MMKERVKGVFYIKCLIFIIAFIPRLICNLSMSPVRVIMDEVCTINSAAYFAGLDWSNVVQKGSYYGIGYYGLFAPLFWITDNPYNIYYCIVIVSSILQALVGVICFNILRLHFKERDLKWCILVSISCSFMVVSRTNDVMNEIPMIVITWIIVWLLLGLSTKEFSIKKRMMSTVFLIILLSYSLTIHTRAVTFWISTIVTVSIVFFISKKWIVSVRCGIIVMLASVPIAKVIIQNYQDYMWRNVDEIINASVSVVISKEMGFFDNLMGMFAIAVGEINTIAVYTGGLAYLVIIISIKVFIQLLKSKDEKTEKLFVVVIFSLVSVGITIGGMMISSWGPGVAKGIARGIDSDYYPYKAITYIRYFGPYLGPLLMVLFIYIKDNTVELGKNIMLALCLSIPMQLYWLSNIIPLLGQNSSSNGAFILFSMWRRGDELSTSIYYISIVAMYNIMGLMYFMYKRGSKNGIVFIASVLLISQYVYGTYCWDVPWSKESESMVDAGYKCISEIQTSIELPDRIYVIDSESTTHHTTYMLYQFYLNRYTIVPGEPNMNDDNIILLKNSKKDNDKYLTKDFEMIELDNNEFLFVKGKDLINTLNNRLN